MDRRRIGAAIGLWAIIVTGGCKSDEDKARELAAGYEAPLKACATAEAKQKVPSPAANADVKAQVAAGYAQLALDKARLKRVIACIRGVGDDFITACKKDGIPEKKCETAFRVARFMHGPKELGGQGP